MKIKTPNFLLRDFHKNDLESYAHFRQDQKFQRFYDGHDCSPEKSAQLIDMFIEWSQEQPRTKFQLAIVENTGEVIGSFGIRMEAEGEASVGCELARLWQGSGAAREVGVAMLEFAFDTLKLRRIYAETISENKPAIRLCESLGLQRETEREQDQFFKGRHWNTLVLSLSRS
jgi:[ribosomal protein S5]-alanine N-acetyltransferase